LSHLISPLSYSSIIFKSHQTDSAVCRVSACRRSGCARNRVSSGRSALIRITAMHQSRRHASALRSMSISSIIYLWLYFD
jgi:hypothetical protein